jgi:hypothetical protein
MTYKNDWDGVLSQSCLDFIKAQDGDFAFCKRKPASYATGVFIGGEVFPFDVYGFAYATKSERALFTTAYAVINDDVNDVEFAIS